MGPRERGHTTEALQELHVEASSRFSLIPRAKLSEAGHRTNRLSWGVVCPLTIAYLR